MRVSALVEKLSELNPDAEVLLLAGSTDISGADELRRVEAQDSWRCEVHFRDDGLSRSLHAPVAFGKRVDFDAAYDRTVLEPVVLLAAFSANLDYMFVDDFVTEGNKLSREWVRSHAVNQRREMLEDGRLISRETLLRLLNLRSELLDELVSDSRIFDISIDGLPYYPSIFANPRINAERLQSIARLLAPLANGLKLDFLLTPWGFLGGLRAIEMLDEAKDYKRVRHFASLRVAESSRTVVRIFDGSYEAAPEAVAPLYMAAAEIDPRRPLWSRATATLLDFGFERPSPPYPHSKLFTIFVEKHFEGEAEGVVEGIVCVQSTDDEWRVRAAWPPMSALVEPGSFLRAEKLDVVSLAKAAFEDLQFKHNQQRHD
jgi:hypothetical protein